MTMNVFIYIWEFGADIFESVLFVLFLNYFHPYKTLKRGNFIASIGTALALIFNILIVDSFSVYSALPFFIDLLIVVFYSSRYLQGTTIVHLRSFALFYLGMFLSTAISALFVRFRSSGIDAWLDIENINRPLFLLGSKLLLFCYVLFVLKFRSKFCCIQNNLARLSYVVVPFASFTIGLWLIQLIFIIPPVRYVKETILLMLFFFLLLLALIFYLSIYAVRELEKEYENRALIKVLSAQKEAAKNMEDGKNEIWKLNHDIGHRMAAIRYFLDNNDTEKGIEELERFCCELNGNIKTVMEGENLGQFIINSKLDSAQCKGILVNKRIAPGFYRGIDPIDFSIILGNLLDNAIESQQNVKEGKIDFVMDEKIGYIFIEVKNPIVGTDGETCLLHAREKDQIKHGYGLPTIRKLVEKNNGRVETCTKKQEFIVRILLKEEI